METTQQESLQTTSNKTDNKNYSKELFTVTEIENTPFAIVEANEKYFIAIGKHRITEIVEDRKILTDMINEKDWNLILNAIIAIHKTEI